MSDRQDVLKFAGSLDIYGVDPARDALLALIRNSATPVLDLESVDACDAAGVQLLISAASSAARANKRISFDHVSSAVAACCERLGCAKELLS